MRHSVVIVLGSVAALGALALGGTATGAPGAFDASVDAALAYTSLTRNVESVWSSKLTLLLPGFAVGLGLGALNALLLSDSFLGDGP
jgi:ribose/xylose/arabinose/galactoside ABC-type transport system permease subunit